MKRVLFTAFIFALLLGCASTPVPCPEEEDVQHKDVVENSANETYRPGYTVLAYDRPGLVGKVAAAPGHVLTTEPDQNYLALELTLEEKKREVLEKLQNGVAAKLKAEAAERRKNEDRIKIPTQLVSQKPSRPAEASSSHKKVSPWRQAWERYCNNGQGLTDEDIEILKRESYVVPVEFRNSCLPPK